MLLQIALLLLLLRSPVFPVLALLSFLLAFEVYLPLLSHRVSLSLALLVMVVVLDVLLHVRLQILHASLPANAHQLVYALDTVSNRILYLVQVQILYPRLLLEVVQVLVVVVSAHVLSQIFVLQWNRHLLQVNVVASLIHIGLGATHHYYFTLSIGCIWLSYKYLHIVLFLYLPDLLPSSADD